MFFINHFMQSGNNPTGRTSGLRSFDSYFGYRISDIDTVIERCSTVALLDK